MTEPEFVTLEDALHVHAHQIEHYGGRPGVRDLGLLRSALGMPQATFDGEFLHPTLAEMAAAYLFHLAQNRPFVDGNKRAALAVALLFLELNGVELEAPDEAVLDVVLKVATGASSKAEVAVFVARRSRPNTVAR
jgi:death-on-curing protein